MEKFRELKFNSPSSIILLYGTDMSTDKFVREEYIQDYGKHGFKVVNELEQRYFYRNTPYSVNVLYNCFRFLNTRPEDEEYVEKLLYKIPLVYTDDTYNGGFSNEYVKELAKITFSKFLERLGEKYGEEVIESVIEMLSSLMEKSDETTKEVSRENFLELIFRRIYGLDDFFTYIGLVSAVTFLMKYYIDGKIRRETLSKTLENLLSKVVLPERIITAKKESMCLTQDIFYEEILYPFYKMLEILFNLPLRLIPTIFSTHKYLVPTFPMQVSLDDIAKFFEKKRKYEITLGDLGEFMILNLIFKKFYEFLENYFIDMVAIHLEHGSREALAFSRSIVGILNNMFDKYTANEKGFYVPESVFVSYINPIIDIISIFRDVVETKRFSQASLQTLLLPFINVERIMVRDNEIIINLNDAISIVFKLLDNGVYVDVLHDYDYNKIMANNSLASIIETSANARQLIERIASIIENYCFWLYKTFDEENVKDSDFKYFRIVRHFKDNCARYSSYLVFSVNKKTNEIEVVLPIYKKYPDVLSFLLDIENEPGELYRYFYGMSMFIRERLRNVFKDLPLKRNAYALLYSDNILREGRRSLVEVNVAYNKDKKKLEYCLTHINRILDIEDYNYCSENLSEVLNPITIFSTVQFYYKNAPELPKETEKNINKYVKNFLKFARENTSDEKALEIINLIERTLKEIQTLNIMKNPEHVDVEKLLDTSTIMFSFEDKGVGKPIQGYVNIHGPLEKNKLLSLVNSLNKAFGIGVKLVGNWYLSETDSHESLEYIIKVVEKFGRIFSYMKARVRESKETELGREVDEETVVNTLTDLLEPIYGSRDDVRNILKLLDTYENKIKILTDHKTLEQYPSNERVNVILDFLFSLKQLLNYFATTLEEFKKGNIRLSESNILQIRVLQELVYMCRDYLRNEFWHNDPRSSANLLINIINKIENVVKNSTHVVYDLLSYGGEHGLGKIIFIVPVNARTISLLSDKDRIFSDNIITIDLRDGYLSIEELRKGDISRIIKHCKKIVERYPDIVTTTTISDRIGFNTRVVVVPRDEDIAFSFDLSTSYSDSRRYYFIPLRSFGTKEGGG